MGVVHTVLGFLTALLLVLSHVSRWWRLFAAPNWFLGISTLVAAYKGLCVILHKNHQRAVKPWEDPAALYSTFTGGDAGDIEEYEEDGHGVEMAEKGYESSSRSSTPGLKRKHGSLDTFGSSNESITTGSSWVKRYEKKSTIKKIFDSKSTTLSTSAVGYEPHLALLDPELTWLHSERGSPR